MFEALKRNSWTVHFIVLAMFGSGPILAADYTTVDMSSYVNSNVAINSQTFPTGTSTGNQGTGVPFNVAAYNGNAGTWNALFSPTGTLDVKLQVPGQSSFYALLNNYFGTPGANEYDVTIKATNGDSVTYSSIGGIDTRDYNSNVYTNYISSTTFGWFDNGVGQRLDLREFNLPASFANETVSDFIITQNEPHDSALLSGLTFSNAAAYSATPEPTSVALMITGLAACGLLRRWRRSE